ncbi:patatin-like phospholipase family protein [Flavobacterium sp.]|uniref:patatin-like phospholipase family protein n=1 Tax=Flavobacterium sp. TaxID=239 RepID=UPI0031D54A0D
MLSYIKQQKDFDSNSADPISTLLHKHFPRLLSFNCYVCLQAAIISLPTIYDWNKFILAGFILFHNLLYFLFAAWLENRNKRIKIICILLVVAYILLFVFLPLNKMQSGLDLDSEYFHQGNLQLLFYMLFIMEILWLVFLVQRRKNVNEKKNGLALENNLNELTAPEGFYGDFMTRLGFRTDFITVEKNYIIWFAGITAVAFGIYVTGIFNITASVYIGSLAYVLLALGILVTVSCVVSLYSIKWSVNLFFILLVWCIGIGSFRDPYLVRTIEAKEKFSYQDRPETKDYLERWFEKRIKLMKDSSSVYANDSLKKFDAYIVLSNGGASRAGYWASYNMSMLQDMSYRLNPENSFKEHLLCLAGASGGSVGNASFYALLKAKHDKKIKEELFEKYSTSFFRKDYLVYPLAHLLGPDIFQSSSPFKGIDDRGDALERSLSESMMEYRDKVQYDTLLKSYFKKPLSEVFDQSGDLPIFYINTTAVDNGAPGVLSNVKLASIEFTSRRTDVLQLVDSLKKENPKTDIRFSTAAILSSRFPYVSPAAKVHSRYFVDGGYFDNSGAGTIFEFSQQLITFLNNKKDDPDYKYYKRFTFHILHFNNSELETDPVKDINPVANDFASPFLTLIGIQGANTSTSNGVLADYFEDQFSRWEERPMNRNRRAIEYNLYEDPALYKRKKEEEIYPMSWVLSEYQMSRIRSAFIRENSKNQQRFLFMKR